MSVDTGIIGLAGSGRTTIFNALTGREIDTTRYTKDGSAPNIGTTKVPEPRLDVLAEMFQPKKIVPTSITYTDIGASVKSLVKDTTIGGELLNKLSGTDALINVVRAFEDESIPHIEGSIDIERDINNMNLELTFSDLALLERRLERILISLKGAKQTERQSLLREQELLMKLKTDLEKDMPIREISLTPEESRAVSSFQLLTAKPLLVVVNIGEDQLSQASSIETDLNTRFSGPKCRFVTICGKLEMELAQLDESEAEALRSDFEIEEPGTDRIIRLTYELLGLVSFFTTASGEVKAWTIQRDTEALKAAGKIHSDMERGFIRAEVISYGELVKSGNITEARKKGLLRLEGKTYKIQDGDVITFLFNV